MYIETDLLNGPGAPTHYVHSPRRRKRHGIGLFALLAVIAGACSSTPRVETETSQGADFSRYRTFALMPLPTASPASDPDRASRLASPARQTVTETLQAKGLSESDRAQSDIVVNLYGKSLPKEEVNNWGYMALPPGRSPMGTYSGVNRYRGENVAGFEQRTLTIEIFDNKSKQLVWTGRCTAEQSGEVKVDQVQDAIRRTLARFPAGSVSK